MGANFIAALSAKLTPTLSPRSSRRHAEDTVSLGSSSGISSHRLSQRGPGQSFLDSLNAKLAHQQISNNPTQQQQQQQQGKANKIRQIINSKAQVS